MPLRVRLIAMVGLVLAVSLGCGSLLVAWRAANSVRLELEAALDVGAKAIRNGVDELGPVNERASELRRLVATFNGNRHVRASLLDADGRMVVGSELLPPARVVPNWFRHLIGRQPGTVRLLIPQGTDASNSTLLRADPTNEVGEVWAESRDAMLVLAGFAVLTALLIYAVAGRVLRPLDVLSRAFEDIGRGDYHGRIPVRGPPELRRLASGFNLMAQRLATIASQNDRLNKRLLTLQAEERADLARDLHDEMGPLLFAIDMTAATIERLAEGGREAEIPKHVHSIHDAVAQMQSHVRAILARLRPLRAVGLATAIDRVAAFWRHRRPDIEFKVSVAVKEDQVDGDLKETIYRIVQEGTSNAIRHGRPSRVEIAVSYDQDDHIRVEVRDDGVGMSPYPIGMADSVKRGLIGMRERVAAIGGLLSIESGTGGRGLAVIASLPGVGSLRTQQVGVPE
jgi:two-component system, NarL family, sensor histidine kinase UhpB